MLNKRVDPIIEEAIVQTVASLVKSRTEELGYDINHLPKTKYISDDILVWLVNKYDILIENIKGDKSDESNK